MKPAGHKRISDAVNKLMLENKLNRSLTNDLIRKIGREREAEKYFVYVAILNTKPLVEYVFNSNEAILIGRDQEGCRICIKDPLISRKHGRIFVQKGFLFIENISENNRIVVKRGFKKTTLYGRDVKEILKDDIVRIGDARIRLLLLQGAETIVN